MRDERFKAVHRGGPLSLPKHRLLADWAAACANRVLHLFTELYPQDDRPPKAINMARAWSRGDVSVGEARTAALAAHAAAKEVSGAAQYAARAAGHAVATAHMADHAPEAAAYAVKAVSAVGQSLDVERERMWQQAQIPKELQELVLSKLEQPST